MNIKNIAIIEIYSHHVFVETLSRVLLENEYQVTIYVNKRIYKDLKNLLPNNNKLNIVLPKNNEGDLKFLLRFKKDIELNNDLIIINTIQGYRILYFYFLNFRIPTIAAAGRISEFFKVKYRFFGFKKIRDFLYHNFVRFFLPKIVSRLIGIIVHTDKAKNIAKSANFLKPIHKMPFSLFKQNIDKYKIKFEGLHFVITGSINETSRDHKSLVKVFERIWGEGIDNVKLTILSSTKSDYGKEMKKIFNGLANKKYNINYFDDWIPEDEYSRISSNADFFIAPIKKDYYSSGELTSVTVESIRTGTPAIYPSWYVHEKKLKKSSIFFDDFDDLYKIIVKLSENIDESKAFKSSAKRSLEVFSLENESKKIKTFLDNLTIEK